MKCKGKIVFSGELFKLDLQSEEKVNAGYPKYWQTFQ